MKKTFIAILLSVVSMNIALAQPALLPAEKDNIAVFEHVSPLVVNVHRIENRGGYYSQSLDVEAGTGSGIIWDHAGHVVTNFHVIKGANKIVVSLHDGKTVPAKVVGVEPRKDIAVLKLILKDSQVDLTQYNLLKIMNSNQLQVGQNAIAIGNPFGLDRTMTTGIISALNRRIPGVGGVTIRDMIQTDASINPGNSGGPLLSSQGELMGMNTVIFSNSGNSAGIGFAVPATDIRRIAGQIIKNGHVIQAGLGIHVFDNQISRQWAIKGVIVGEVMPKGPGAKAGLKPTYRNGYGHINMGDVIIAIDDQPVKNYDDLYNIMAEKKVGETIHLTLIRDNKKHVVELTTADLSKI